MRKALLALLLLTACSEPKTHEVIRPVNVHTVQPPEAGRVRTFSGTAKASEESSLSFKVSGTIVYLPVDVGTEVEEGQVLAALDPLDYELEVEKNEAELARAKARSRNAQANYDRVRSLYETRTVSKTDLDNARAEAESGIAAVASAEKALALSMRQLEYTSLEAVTDGWIAQKLAEVKENVRPSEPILVMVSGTQPEVDIQIPETIIGYVRQGMPVTARFPALNGKVLEGEVIKIGVATTGTTTTFPVTLLIDDPNHRIRSGMTAEITFQLPYTPGSEIVRIPSVAVSGDLEGPFVFVVEDGVVRRQPVVVGELLGDEIEILEGLKGNEKVVTAGTKYLREGMQVTIYKGKPYGEGA